MGAGVCQVKNAEMRKKRAESPDSLVRLYQTAGETMSGAVSRDHRRAQPP
jgi:hypothetical protein